MIYYLLLTAFTVSIDSFFCGFSLSFLKGKKRYIIFIITLTVFIMCLITNYGVKLLNLKASKITLIVGGALLALIGLINLFKKEQNIQKGNGSTLIKQSFIVGFAVGLDGAGANLSLSLMGINALYVPLTIALMHGVLISLSILLEKCFIGQKMEKFAFISPVILIILGGYKILTVLI